MPVVTPGKPESTLPGAVPVVVVGSVNVDYLISVERRPQRGETVLAGDVQVLGGGKGANQAVAAARSGAAVELVARVGEDSLGAQRLADLAAQGVGTAYVRRAAGHLTGMAFVTLTPDGENDIVVAPGANASLVPRDVDAASGLLSGPSVLLAQLEVPLDSVMRAVELAGPSTRVVFNCSPWRPLPQSLLAKVDVLVLNELEAAAMAGMAVAGVDDALAAGAALAGAGPRSVVVTLGPAGAVMVSPGQAQHLPAPRARVIDTTGAGDAFAGALAARYAAGESLFAAAAFGVVVGSATTERKGAAAVVPPRAAVSFPRVQ